MSFSDTLKSLVENFFFAPHGQKKGLQGRRPKCQTRESTALISVIFFFQGRKKGLPMWKNSQSKICVIQIIFFFLFRIVKLQTSRSPNPLQRIILDRLGYFGKRLATQGQGTAGLDTLPPTPSKIKITQMKIISIPLYLYHIHTIPF